MLLKKKFTSLTDCREIKLFYRGIRKSFITSNECSRRSTFLSWKFQWDMDALDTIIPKWNSNFILINDLNKLLEKIYLK